MHLQESILAAGAFAVAAQAQAVLLQTPPNGYLGALRSTISCTVLDLITLTLDSTFAAVGPIVLEEGQQFYGNDVAANLTLPAFVGTLAGAIGVDHADVKLFIDVLSENGYPETLQAFPDGLWINGTKLNSGSDTVIGFPKDGGVIGGIGPFTAGKQGIYGLYVGKVKAEFYLYNKDNKLILETDADCPIPKYNVDLASFNIVPATSDSPPLLDVKNGYLLPYPPLQPQTQYGCFEFQYDCFAGDIGPLGVATQVCAGVGSLYEVKKSYSVFDLVAAVTIPEADVVGLKGLFPGTVALALNTSETYVELTNASPASINGVPEGGLSQTVQLPASGNLTFTIPPQGGITFDPFTVADNAGGTVFLLVGNSTSSVVFLDASSNSVGSKEIVCNPHVPHLSTAGVTIVPAGAINSSMSGL